MKTVSLIAALLLGTIAPVAWADEAANDRIKEIDAKIDELQKEKTRLLAEMKSDREAGLYDSTGMVNPRVVNSVLIIEGDKSVGTGFVIKSGDKKYLYTAAHVFSGNSKLTIRSAGGREFKKFGDLQAAEGADLIRLEILEDAPDFLELAAPDLSLPINTAIAALGNGGGNGVAAVETGTILGVSGDTIEVTTQIIQGNSGGPIVDVATCHVVGEATHLSTARNDLWSEGTRQGEVRRFACRLNKEWKWMTMKTSAFLADGRSLEEFDGLTRLCFAIAQLQPYENGLRLDSVVGGDRTAASILNENSTDDLVKSLVSMNTELANRKTSLSDAELIKKFRSLIAQAESRASRSAQALKPPSMAWFHRTRATMSIDARNKCIAALKQRLGSFK